MEDGGSSIQAEDSFPRGTLLEQQVVNTMLHTVFPSSTHQLVRLPDMVIQRSISVAHVGSSLVSIYQTDAMSSDLR